MASRSLRAIAVCGPAVFVFLLVLCTLFSFHRPAAPNLLHDMSPKYLAAAKDELATAKENTLSPVAAQTATSAQDDSQQLERAEVVASLKDELLATHKEYRSALARKDAEKEAIVAGMQATIAEKDAVAVNVVIARRNLSLPIVFLHIPKTGGASLASDWNSLELGPRPAIDIHPTRALDAVPLKQSLFDHPSRNDRLSQLITFVRDPVMHVISQYNHCQQSTAQGHRMHHYDPINIKDWLAYVRSIGGLSAANTSFTRFCNYFPMNMLTRYLSFGTNQVGVAVRNIHGALFVGVLERRIASLCVLKDALGQVLPNWCNCSHGATAKFRVSLQSCADGKHCSHGVNASSFKLTKDVLKLVNTVTRRDHIIYGIAMLKLRERARAILRKTGLDVLKCD